MLEIPFNPEQHPAVQALKILLEPGVPLPDYQHCVEHAERAAANGLENPALAREYPRLVNRAIEQATAAAASRPERLWREALTALQQAALQAEQALGQVQNFADEDQEFLQEQWRGALLSLKFAQEQVYRPLHGEPTTHRLPPLEPSSLAEVMFLFNRLRPFDRAALAREMTERIIRDTPDLPENVAMEFQAAAANLMIKAAHPGEDDD